MNGRPPVCAKVAKDILKGEESLAEVVQEIVNNTSGREHFCQIAILGKKREVKESLRLISDALKDIGEQAWQGFRISEEYTITNGIKEKNKRIKHMHCYMISKSIRFLP